jgi:hypothetical protein
MAAALLTIASGDRKLSEVERRWILGYFAAKGCPPAIIDEMSRFSTLMPDGHPNLHSRYRS